LRLLLKKWATTRIDVYVTIRANLVKAFYSL
jgi:hypothetical protein